MKQYQQQQQTIITTRERQPISVWVFDKHSTIKHNHKPTLNT